MLSVVLLERTPPHPPRATHPTKIEGTMKNGYEGSVTPAVDVTGFNDESIAPVACPDNTNGANLPAGCASNTGWHGVVVATSIIPHYYTVDLDGAGAAGPVDGGAVAACTAQATGCDVPGTECMDFSSEHYDKLKW